MIKITFKEAKEMLKEIGFTVKIVEKYFNGSNKEKYNAYIVDITDVSSKKSFANYELQASSEYKKRLKQLQSIRYNYLVYFNNILVEL